MKKEKTDYLFGVQKLNEDTKQIDGYLHFRKPHKAIVEFYKRIKIKEKLQETGKVYDAFSIDNSSIENEMKEKRIVFYSLRHTFQTLLATKYKGQTLLIDYFMGHKPAGAMLANYLHINQVDEKTYWNEYGKLLIDFQNQFIATENKERREFLKKFIADKFVENKHLVNEDGSMSIDNALETIIQPLLVKPKQENDDTDDFFFDVV
jgi:hypothetical protein